MSEVVYLNGDRSGWIVNHVYGSNYQEYIQAFYNKTGSMEWVPVEEGWRDWLSEDYKSYEFPLSDFGTDVANQLMYTSGTLWEIYEKNPSLMPDKVDVTEWYVRSEKVMDIMCDMFERASDAYNLHCTYWVDPSTGFTLKYKEVSKTDNNETLNSYEVTKLVIGSPDWNGLHLQPREGDTVN
jgi:hypothetical protein